MTRISQAAISTLTFALLAFGAIHAQATQITILTENGQPVIGADILVGPAEGTPFLNNKLKTDLNGQATIPPEWVDHQPVTVLAGGYRAATFLAVEPVATTLQVHREDSRTKIEVRGETTSYDNLRKDGKVDFALVYPALRQHQLAQFDVSSMISPEVDMLEVVTESIAVPSNLALPEQKENYVLPITLSKPVYRIGFKQTGDYRITALHGQFPLRQVVGDIRDGKAFYSVLNHFKIVGGGQRDVAVNNSMNGQNIPVNQLVVDKKLTVRGPAMNNELIMFSMALANSSGYYYPTDIKMVAPNQGIELLAPSRADETSLLSVLMTKADAEKIGGRGSKAIDLEAPAGEEIKKFYNHFIHLFSIVPTDELDEIENLQKQAAGGVSIVRHNDRTLTPQFLSLVPRPAIQGNTLTVTAPTVVDGITPIATYVVLSEIEYKNTGKYTLENKFRLWEIAEAGWASQMTLPESPVRLVPGKKYRWEVLFMGQQNGQNEKTGEYFLNAVTHVSRNSLDL
jgi:hypothetical protein